FQAEDGIRDRNVTGVQTCALPILGELGLPCDEGIVEAAVERLRRAHLLEDGGGASPSEGRISRRALGRKLGLVGGMMVMLPLVKIGRASCRERGEGAGGGGMWTEK